MKKSRSVVRAPNHAEEDVQGTSAEPQESNVPPEESESLSPKRIMDGVATKTKVLDGILAHQGQQYRHWGINE